MDLARGRAWAWLTVILALAGTLRLWYVLELPGQGRDLLFSDMNAYDVSGWHMVLGKPVTGEPGFNGYHPLSASTYYPPGYTYFVAALYAAFGHVPRAVRLAQALLGTATVGLVYGVGARAFGRASGLVAAALTAVYLPLVYYQGLILSETWFTFLQMTALALWLRAWGPPPTAQGSGAEAPAAGGGGSTVLTALAGVIAGLACLTRTAFLAGVAALVVGAVAWPPARSSLRRRAARAALFLAGAVAVIAPVTVRNYQIHRRVILISTNGPSTFLTGHVDHSWLLPSDLPPGTTDVALADRHRERSRLYLAEHGADYLAEIPEFFESIWLSAEFWPATTSVISYIRLEGVDQPARIRSMADNTWGPPFARVTHFPDLMRHVDRVVWLLIGLPMGLLAALFLPRHHRRWSVLYLALLPYVVIPFIAPPFGRYRMPAVPLVFLLAGQALTACWSRRNPPA